MSIKQNGGYTEKCGNEVFDLPIVEASPLTGEFDEMLTVERLLREQEEDGFIPMCYVPFCGDEAGDFFYFCTDKKHYGAVYYICHEFLDDFLESPDEYEVADDVEEFDGMVMFKV